MRNSIIQQRAFTLIQFISDPSFGIDNPAWLSDSHEEQIRKGTEGTPL